MLHFFLLLLFLEFFYSFSFLGKLILSSGLNFHSLILFLLLELPFVVLLDQLHDSSLLLNMPLLFYLLGFNQFLLGFSIFLFAVVVP